MVRVRVRVRVRAGLSANAIRLKIRIPCNSTFKTTLLECAATGEHLAMIGYDPRTRPGVHSNLLHTCANLTVTMPVTAPRTVPGTNVTAPRTVPGTRTVIVISTKL